MRYIVCLLLCVGLVGCGMPSLLITPVKNVNSLKEVTAEPGKGFAPDKIAIIGVEGMLMNARSGGFLGPKENKLSLFTQELEQAENDDSVKAIVLRINSPGGTVATADTMYTELMNFRAKTHKPIVADAQDLVASGAYYVACAADKIVAEPTSVVGSIGVIFETFDIENGLHKIGVSTEAIKSAPLKDLASPFHHRTDAERKVLQRIVNEYYARFKGIVATRRHITDQKELAYLANGQVFTGTDAVKLKLADVNGSLPDAINLAKQLADAPDAKVIMYKRPYGYSGSIYAASSTPEPKESNSLHLTLPGADLFIPPGFYYLWRP